jgi:hypothetical protein
MASSGIRRRRRSLLSMAHERMSVGRCRSIGAKPRSLDVTDDHAPCAGTRSAGREAAQSLPARPFQFGQLRDCKRRQQRNVVIVRRWLSGRPCLNQPGTSNNIGFRDFCLRGASGCRPASSRPTSSKSYWRNEPMGETARRKRSHKALLKRIRPVKLSITHNPTPWRGQRPLRNVESKESLVIHC